MLALDVLTTLGLPEDLISQVRDILQEQAGSVGKAAPPGYPNMCSTPWSVSAWITISAPVILSAIANSFLSHIGNPVS